MSRLLGSSRIIATASQSHFAHKSCAVKLHAYTLDSSCYDASAVQQWLLCWLILSL